jgi:predicted Kef-type K+ transport protein
MLLLFTIGLKLKIRSLLRPEIWAGAHAVYNIYAEAGFGFAEHVCQALEDAGEFSAEKTGD